MKLLIVTQVIDTEHPVLGFFHRWVEEFATHCEHVHVICLQAGKHSLPANVTVHSLGKENGVSRFTYIRRFYSLIWKLRTEYDSVFVHMNQEYILLGGILWKSLGKKISMWRNHYSGSWLTDIAAKFCLAIFYTSAASYTKKFSHAHAMPIGIDGELFAPVPGVSRKPGSMLFVGRLSRSKRIHVLLAAFQKALQQRPELTLSIVGGTTSPEDEQHETELKNFAAENNLPVSFVGPVPWAELPNIYSAHELCINLSPPGMFDKVIGESLLCECDILTTNQDLSAMLRDVRVIEHLEIGRLVDTLIAFEYSKKDVKNLRATVFERQSLDSTATKVVQNLG